MNNFQQQVMELLARFSPVWLVGGTVRDRLWGTDSKDLDLVCFLEPAEAEKILLASGYTCVKTGRAFPTLSVFKAGIKDSTQNGTRSGVPGDSRIDLTFIKDLEQDALRRDFTINAIFQNPFNGEIFDPLGGRGDLKAKVLRACTEQTFRGDPVRILRLIKFAVKYDLEIERQTWEKAKESMGRLAETAKERITAELAEILILPQAEKGVRMLLEIGYFQAFIPELARLKGLEQNQYHSLDVWEHTLAVFRNTPSDLFLRLAALFHDIGKWETASRECYLAGKLEYRSGSFVVEGYTIVGTGGTERRGSRADGRNELESRLKRFIGREVKILGARLDHDPQVVQFKRNLTGEPAVRGLTMLENGKRHFLNHERAGAKLLPEILKRYCFAMFFAGAGQKREKDLQELIANHMLITLTFMPELRGKPATRSLKERAAELAWQICWDRRTFELPKIYDFIALCKADYEAGKIHNEAQNRVMEEVLGELASAALWQQENHRKINWQEFNRFAAEHNLRGEELGKLKEKVLARAVRDKILKPDILFIKKIFEK